MKLNVASMKLRLSALERYIAELEKRRSATQEELATDFGLQLIVERAFQAAIECCIDLASHVVATYRLGQAQEQRELFQFLAGAGYLDPAFAATMGHLVAFRNRLVHVYWDVDPGLLHQYLQEDVAHLRRFREFALRLVVAEEQGTT